MKKLISVSMVLLGISLGANEVNESNLASYQSKCEARDGEACDDLGYHYSRQFSHSRGTDTQAKELMRKYYMKACNELRYGSSCHSLASHYNIDEKDEISELEFNQKGCDYNHANSCNGVGFYYLNKSRKETDRNLKKQYESKKRIAFKKACDLGSKAGCSNYKEL